MKKNKKDDRTQSQRERAKRGHVQTMLLGQARADARKNLGPSGWADMDEQGDPAVMCRVGRATLQRLWKGQRPVRTLTVLGAGRDWDEALRNATR